MKDHTLLVPDLSLVQEAFREPELFPLGQSIARVRDALEEGNLPVARTAMAALEGRMDPDALSPSHTRLLRAFLLGARAALSLMENRPDPVEEYTGEGFALLEALIPRSLPARRLQVWLLALHAEAQFQRGAVEEALQTYLSALEALEEVLQDAGRTVRSAFRLEQAQLLLRLGHISLADGFPAEGLPYLREALRLARQISRRDPDAGTLLRIRVLDLLSRVEGENGELRRSLRHLQEALPLLDQIRDRNERRRWEGHLFHRKALIFLALGDMPAALDAAQKAVVARKFLARRRNSPHRRDYAQSLLLLALALQAVGKMGDAKRALDRSVRIHQERWRREGSPDAGADLAAALLERAELLADMKEWTAALRDSARALRLLEPLSPEAVDGLEDWVHACRVRARIYQDKGDLPRAQRMLEQTLRQLDRMNAAEGPVFDDLARTYIQFLRKTRRKAGRGMERLLSPRFPFPRS